MAERDSDARPERPGPPAPGTERASGPLGAAQEYTSFSADMTRNELEAAKEYAEMVLNTIREALLVLTLDLRVRSANRSFYAFFETTPEETEGRYVYDLGNGQWDIPELRRLLEEILPEDESFDDYEVEHEFEEIGRRTIVLNARRVDHHDMILLAIEDVTERRSGERRLRESQERFDLLVQNAREYAIFMMDPDTTITMWSPGAERILGWAEAEVLGKKGDIIFTPEDRAAGAPEEELARARRDGAASDDRWHVRRDGSRFWATGHMIALYGADGALRGLAKVLRDDTDRKEAEEERQRLIQALERERTGLERLNETLEERVAEQTRQVRGLASTLTMAEQEERRRISRILHDDLQQRLYGIQMKMVLLRGNAEAQDWERLAADLTQAEEWLGEAVATTRNLTVDLSPPLLHGEGLTDALHWLVSQMREMHGLTVELTAEHAFSMADQDLRVLLFQIVRELLFNVVKHAGVDRAAVRLDQLDHHFAIRVSDAGRGFDVAETARRSEREGGFGLFSVRERLNLFGGSMEIDSAPGQGTTVTVYTPTVLEPRSDAAEPPPQTPPKENARE